MENTMKLKHAAEMAYHHKCRIARDGLDQVPEPIKAISYATDKGTDEARALHDVIKFIGAFKYNNFSEISIVSPNKIGLKKFKCSCACLGLAGFPVLIWARVLGFDMAFSELDECIKNGAVGGFNYSIELHELIHR